MAKLQVMTLDNLTLYDGLIKGYIDEAAQAVDAKSLKTVALVGNTLKFYTVSEPVGETAPVYEITLPETDLSGLITKMENAKAGNVVVANADGTVSDGGVALADLATKEGVETAIEASLYDDTQVKADIKANADAIAEINDEESGVLAQSKTYADNKVKDASDTINATIGEVTEGKTVVEMIADAQTAATYDDTEVRELIADNAEAIEAHKTAIDGTVATLVGTDTGKSVRTIANEELAAQLIGENAKESLDTLEEIAAWIQSHPDDASAMNKAIEDLGKLVGTLPEGVTATTVVGYVQELVNAEKSRAEGVESGLDTRIKAVEDAIGENGSVTKAIADAKKAGTDATDAVTALADGQVKTNTEAIAKNAEDIVALQQTLGEGVEPISSDAINALFS